MPSGPDVNTELTAAAVQAEVEVWADEYWDPSLAYTRWLPCSPGRTGRMK